MLDVLAAPSSLVGVQLALRHFEVCGPLEFREDTQICGVQQRAHLRVVLARRLYERCHLQGAALRSIDEGAQRYPIPLWIEEIIETLDGLSWCQPGWVVSAPQADGVVVERDGLRVAASREQATIDAGRTEVGAAVSLRIPVLRPAALRGFLVAASPHGAPSVEDLWRLYIHPKERDAERAFLYVYRALSAAHVRFQLKIARLPSLIGRPDAMVVFVPHGRLGEAVTMARRCESWLTDPTPGFAERIGRGMAIAREPGGDLSYGQQVAVRVADGLIEAWRAGARDTEKRLHAVERHLQELEG